MIGTKNRVVAANENSRSYLRGVEVYLECLRCPTAVQTAVHDSRKAFEWFLADETSSVVSVVLLQAGWLAEIHREVSKPQHEC